ncbi:ImmA/IrrE family metallo-endopeptidase [Lentibacillus amyloliquefaciens]|uniref:IrrE N-terminal-like domain-containing protein n=1 Tax=Lentibacillus amyloliquefaciens TaxID=1472767 RepID=A0A0U3NLD4_9BACI|nr:ImmA/IrrE family metallo-endopeptidase [Lentibacillus amyloliquefaciens]ALX47611.1 hypothetical protein AOX59_02735 [Lentibacillus amyloliquefaciens]
MKYITTPLEDSIQKLYWRIGIKEPKHSIEDIATRLGISICYQKIPLSADGIIFIDPLQNKCKQREVFTHELGHVLQHVGVQLGMPEDFRHMQEAKARNFALHFTVPTFMLLELSMPKYRNQAVNLIAERFGVTHDFADERLLHYERQITGELFFEELLKGNESTEDYSPGEIDIYGDLPFYEQPDFKELIEEFKKNGATDDEIQDIIAQIKYKEDISQW